MKKSNLIDTAISRKSIPFPECSLKCDCVEYFGVCECESICPHKFDKDGNPIKEIIQCDGCFTYMSVKYRPEHETNLCDICFDIWEAECDADDYQGETECPT